MTIRLRLAVWYGVLMAGTLAVVGAFVWVSYSHDLRSSLDEALAVQAADVAAGLQSIETRRLLREDPARPGIFTEVLDSAGRISFSSPSAPRGIGRPDPGPSTVPLADGSAYAVFTASGADGRTVIAGSSLASVDRDIGHLAEVLAIAGVAALVASIGGGWWLARRGLAPIALLIARADEAQAAEAPLSVRLPEPSTRDEVGRLARTLNRMLERVDAAVSQQRAFVAAASHDLRTPIAVVRTELELAIRARSSATDLRAAVARALDDLRRLSGLTDDLLGLAAAEQDGRPIENGAFDVRELVEAAVNLAHAGGVAVEPEIDVDGAWVVGDRVRIEQALGNLLSNAFRHSPAPGTVTVRARVSAERGSTSGMVLVVDVLDRGPGVPPERRGTIFLRFGRRPGVDGYALGLATADAAIRALGGRIGYRDRPGGGAWFWFRVPVDELRPMAIEAGAALRPQ